MTEATSERDPLDMLAEEFLHARRKGAKQSVTEFAAAHPEHADGLKEILPAMLALEQMRRERESTASGGPAPHVPQLERLDDYKIVREVGRGGMGVVFEAVQESLGRRVALKVLPAQALPSERQLERFRREAQTAARLHHSNIVPVFGSGHTGGYHFYAMQFIDGRGLDQLAEEWRHQDRLHVAQSSDVRERCHKVARIGTQAAAGLQHAHDHGVLHRDVKPSNLLIEADGHVWVADFGLAKALESEGLTNSGDVLGTLQYMAPEQFTGQYDARSEVYALGLTLYELLAGEAAFRGTNRAEMVERIRRGKLERLDRRMPGIPRDLATVIHKAIATEPADRYQQAREFADELERFLQDRPIRARPVSSAEQFWRFCRRNKALATLGASTVLAVMLAAVVGWTFYVDADIARGKAQENATAASNATVRAQNNVRLALAAFEDVFDALVGPDPFHAITEDPETGDFAAAAYTAVSPRDAALLEKMLTFYGRFAESNADVGDLREQTAKAHRRVGTIRARLGDAAAAERAFIKALELYQDVTGPGVRIDVATVHAELGQVLLRQDSKREAVERFRTALRLLESEVPDTGQRSRYERAHAHYLLATALQWAGRPGMGPGGPGRGDRGRGPGNRPEPPPDRSGPGGPAGKGRGQGRSEPTDPADMAQHDEARSHLERARVLVDQLLAEDPGNTAVLLMKARCRSAEARPWHKRPRNAEDQVREAITILEDLVKRYPSVHQYRYELVQTYEVLEGLRARGGPGGPGSSPALADPEGEMRDAGMMAAHAQELVQLAPGQHEYQLALAHSRNRVAREWLRKYDPPRPRDQPQRNPEPPAKVVDEQQRARDMIAVEALLREALEITSRIDTDPVRMTRPGDGDIARAQVASCQLLRGEREPALQEADLVIERLRQLVAARPQTGTGEQGQMPDPREMLRDQQYWNACDRLARMLFEPSAQRAKAIREQVGLLRPGRR